MTAESLAYCDRVPCSFCGEPKSDGSCCDKMKADVDKWVGILEQRFWGPSVDLKPLMMPWPPAETS